MKYKNNLTSECIEYLVEEYSDMILRIAIHHVNSRSEGEDIVQGVFLKLIEKCPEFQDKAHEKAWIIRVTINLCKDYFKTPWYRKIIPINEALTYCDDFEEDITLNYIKKLPANQRNAIYLYYYEELSVEEIAKILSVKNNTVISWLHRGRGNLKTLLKGEVEYE